MYAWNPRDYAQHSKTQEILARELLTQIDLRPDDTVLDIGCGDGRTTADIARSVPNGSVVGIDLSADMVAYATTQHCPSKTHNLRFARADAAALPFTSEFSVVFSNASLHWVCDQRAAVQGIARALRPGGRAIAQLGGQGNVADVIASFERVAEAPRWHAIATLGDMPYHFHSATSYATWLDEAGMEIQECRLLPMDLAHDNVPAFIGWLRTAWHPYTAGVPGELREAFLQDVATDYLGRHPRDHAGQVHVAMVRLQFRAQKV
jgi:trans-aconitate 2-methyltransferase